MSAIRMQVSAEEDGELHVRGLPIRKGEPAEVIILTDAHKEPSADEVALAILRHDPAWQWLWDPSEDLYSESDVRPDGV